MVIANQACKFFGCANLMLVLVGAQEQEWDELHMAVKQFQNVNLAIKYAKKPVVAAPQGMALGGVARSVCTPREFIPPPPPGIEAHSRFHQSDVRFRGGMNSRGVQTDLATPSSAMPCGGRHYRLFRVLDRQIHVLKLLHRHVQLVPFLFLRADQHQH